MAEYVEGPDTELFEIECHTGGFGGIIIPIGNVESRYISLSPLEAKELIALLHKELEEYKKELEA